MRRGERGSRMKVCYMLEECDVTLQECANTIKITRQARPTITTMQDPGHSTRDTQPWPPAPYEDRILRGPRSPKPSQSGARQGPGSLPMPKQRLPQLDRVGGAVLPQELGFGVRFGALPTPHYVGRTFFPNCLFLFSHPPIYLKINGVNSMHAFTNP